MCSLLDKDEIEERIAIMMHDGNVSQRVATDMTIRPRHYAAKFLDLLDECHEKYHDGWSDENTLQLFSRFWNSYRLDNRLYDLTLLHVKNELAERKQIFLKKEA